MSNLDLWAEALESGEFAQAEGQLRGYDVGNKPAMCCLGVACEVYRRETGQGRWRKDGFVWYFDLPGTAESATLPPEVREWLGVRTSNPPLTDPETGVEEAAAIWNDREGADFAQIAKMVRNI